MRRNVANKPFVPGGVYHPNVPAKPLVVPPVAAAPAAPTPPVETLPMPIIVKEEPVACSDTVMEEVSDTVSNNATDVDIGGRISFKKIFQKRKKSSERTRDKKLRQNRQLRKSMLPKNALMALNEVKGINISDFTINSNPDGGFTAVATVNGVQYEGKGQSKMAAKNQACEKALRDYIIARMTPRMKKMEMEVEENKVPEANESSPEDDVPMLNLASFAIYKLFAEWEREGFVVPEMHPNAVNVSAPQTNPNSPTAAATPIPKEPKKPPVRTELPPNWETMHPATLLCVMRPGLTYIDDGSVGDKPNVMQRLGVIVDNQEFVANGRSKKIARRNVAVNVCNTLFNTNFAYEEY